MCSSSYLCVQYKSLLAILEFLASLPYAARVEDFIFKYRKFLQPRSLFTDKPQVIFICSFAFYQLSLIISEFACFLLTCFVIFA